MSVSVDNFLKTVYTLKQEEEGPVTGTLLASVLKVSSAAVTDMTRKLSAKGLVDYTPYKEVELTMQGTKHALEVLRKHRLWELFLFQVLGMDLNDVHQEAERLEHETSDRLVGRLDEFLGFPQFDPHGEPIPMKDGSMPEILGLFALSDLEPGGIAVVAKLRIREKDVFELFDGYGIRPGTTIEAIRTFAFDGSAEVLVGEQKVVLSSVLLKRIFCKSL